MQRIKVILCILVLFSYHGLNAQTSDSQELEIDNEYSNYYFSFKPLEKNETLFYQYVTNSFQIFRIQENMNKELIHSWTNVRSGGYQISKDRKRIVFSIYKSGYYRPTFLVDAEKGIVTYLFNAPNGYRTDAEIRYIIGTDWKSQSDKENVYNEIKKYKILVYSIDDVKLLRTFEWSLNNKYGSIEFLRSQDEKYDFRLIYDSEALMYADAYYNVESQEFSINIDLTCDLPDLPMEYSTTYEENGFLPK